MAYNGGAGPTTVTLSCEGQPTVTRMLAADTLETISTGWTAFCLNLTIGSASGAATNFDDLLIERPALTAQEQLLTFNDRGTGALNGSYPAGVADWGTGVWRVSGSYGAFTTRSVSFRNAGILSGAISFPTPMKLVSLQAHNGGSAPTTLTLKCDGGQDKVVTLAAGETLTIATGFAGTCSSVTVASTNGWDTNLDNLLVAS